MRILYPALSASLVAALGPAPSAQAGPTVVKRTFEAGDTRLALELLDEELVRFELASPQEPAPLPPSPMVAQASFAGTSQAQGATATGLETRTVRLDVDPNNLCVTAYDKRHRVTLTTLCPYAAPGDSRGVTLAQAGTQHLYGLGEQFIEPGVTDGDWVGRLRSAGPFGNDMVAFNGGMVGNAQFPILYALGAGKAAYALFLDQGHAVRWDFTETPWRIVARGEAVRGYLITGDDLTALRGRYMALVGTPLVPPRQMFGLWLSKYGYRSWEEVRAEVAALRDARIPVDGVVLDLYWFGGVDAGGPKSRMGSLAWDEAHFPRPRETLAALRRDGIAVMPIEAAYVAEGLPEHASLAARGALVHVCGTRDAARVIHDSVMSDRDSPKASWFWGGGGMLDWTQSAVRREWHATKRQPLVDAGVLGHWTDLGEPRFFNYDGCYAGGEGAFPAPARQADVHNLYNFLWHQGIFEGYEAAGGGQRPFMLSRSGTSGIQRFGAALGSGDIAANLSSLASHQNAQMHMSLSGIDYFGSDIGGFWRSALDGDIDELYTRWLLHGALFDVPVRPHTMDVIGNKTTNPAKLGDVEANRRALVERYRLTPYLYSLAHRAHRFGEAVVPPLVYAFPDDPNVRRMGSEKMIGPWLLAATSTRAGQTARDIYLPRGVWYNVRSLQRHDSRGTWLRDVPVLRDGHLSLPLYARAGAILPEMPVDDGTLNTAGKRTDGAASPVLRLRVFGHGVATRFTLYEDDGETTGYLRGALRETELAQGAERGRAYVSIGAAQGTYAGAEEARAVALDWVGAWGVGAVQVDGRPLAHRCDADAFAVASEGWTVQGAQVSVKAGSQTVQKARRIELVPGKPPACAAAPAPR
ncbi:MAG TPA: TIM-barrel domain-containing protein [Myxococcota bacterium]|nr:TIM-barrel domain-containing protein [Myxococcota bacterium]